jgi:hypothetical protein
VPYDFTAGNSALYLLVIWFLIIFVGSIVVGFVITIVEERRHTPARKRGSRMSRHWRRRA